LLRFVFGDFFNTSSVASAFEFGLEPDLDHAIDKSIAEQVGREAEDIRVVVPAAHFCRQVIVAIGCSDSMKLVGDNAHAHAGSTNENPSVGGPVGNGSGGGRGEVGVVDAVA